MLICATNGTSRNRRNLKKIIIRASKNGLKIAVFSLLIAETATTKNYINGSINIIGISCPNCCFFYRIHSLIEF